MSLIDLPSFLTSTEDKIPLPKFLKHNNRCTKCQVSCEPHSQCGTCEYCQTSCQTNCNGSSMTCTSGCQVNCQTSCEKGCQTICERNCQTSCQKASQDNSCGSCQKCQSGCQTFCERDCQNSCEVTSQCGTCQSNCQTSCLSKCQSACEKGCQSACEKKSQSCSTNCQKTCQAGCQIIKLCSKCEDGCQFSCLFNCQSKCELNRQCGEACQSSGQACTITCEKQCQGCEYYNQCGNYQASCNYAEKPVVCNNGCQNQAESCRWILMAPCDLECQKCQAACEKRCQSSCQASSQCGSCESCEGCQSSCERRCQNCQSSCEKKCQNCQTACEKNVQHTHTFKTYYEQKDSKQHRKFDRCDADNYIINDILENHIYNNETIYEDGAIYQICTKCGYRNKLKDIPDFEWDIPKGSDTSDVCITHTEWNRFLDILSLKLESCRQDKDVEAIRVKKHEIITAQKFNMVIDKLIFIKASNIPTKVDPAQLILPTTHLNGIRDSLNSVRKCT